MQRVLRIFANSLLTTLAWTSIPTLAADDLQSTIDSLAKPYVEAGIVQGMSIGIWRKGESSIFGYGHRSDNASPVPDGNTIYEIGSVSKTFTGLLLADGVVRKEVRLDQPLQELLPSDVKVPTRGTTPIQLLHLSTHTSGLPRLPDNLDLADPENPYATYTPELLFDFLKGHTLSRDPGSRMEYSNLGAGLLGFTLARHAKKSFGELLKERVLDPLEMSDTTIQLSAAQQKRLALPHALDGKPTKNWDVPVLEGAGAIRSSTNDMLKYVAAIADPKQSPLREAIELAWKVQQKPLNPEDFALGLGWHVARDEQTRWHNGESGGYHSIVLIHRGLQLGVVVLANTATGEVDALGQEIVRALAGQKVTPRKFERPVEVGKEVLARYLGRYEMTPQFQIEITEKEGHLMLQATNQPQFELYARSETEWFLRVVEATVTFQVDDKGICNELDLFQNGLHLPAKRVKE